MFTVDFSLGGRGRWESLAGQVTDRGVSAFGSTTKQHLGAFCHFQLTSPTTRISSRLTIPLLSTCAACCCTFTSLASAYANYHHNLAHYVGELLSLHLFGSMRYSTVWLPYGTHLFRSTCFR